MSSASTISWYSEKKAGYSLVSKPEWPVVETKDSGVWLTGVTNRLSDSVSLVASGTPMGTTTTETPGRAAAVDTASVKKLANDGPSLGESHRPSR